jgi:hypothetical protein
MPSGALKRYDEWERNAFPDDSGRPVPEVRIDSTLGYDDDDVITRVGDEYAMLIEWTADTLHFRDAFILFAERFCELMTELVPIVSDALGRTLLRALGYVGEWDD